MSKLFRRIIVILLVPCLIADQAITALGRELRAPGLVVFASQALAEPLESSTQLTGNPAIKVEHLLKPEPPASPAIGEFDARAYIQAYHAGHISFEKYGQEDRSIDSKVGWNINPVEQRIKQRVGHDPKDEEGNLYWSDGQKPSPYTFIRQAFQAITITSSDIFYDLGSGYSRVVVYAAAATQAIRIIGIEFIAEKVAEAVRVCEKNNFQQTAFVTANVRDADFSDGTVFYLFNPFIRETRQIVFDRLRKIAQNHPIHIMAVGSYWQYFQEMPDSFEMATPLFDQANKSFRFGAIFRSKATTPSFALQKPLRAA